MYGALVSPKWNPLVIILLGQSIQPSRISFCDLTHEYSQ